jgi:hypothetical protein
VTAEAEHLDHAFADRMTTYPLSDPQDFPRFEDLERSKQGSLEARRRDRGFARFRNIAEDSWQAAERRALAQTPDLMAAVAKKYPGNKGLRQLQRGLKLPSLFGSLRPGYPSLTSSNNRALPSGRSQSREPDAAARSDGRPGRQSRWRR